MVCAGTAVRFGRGANCLEIETGCRVDTNLKFLNRHPERSSTNDGNQRGSVAGDSTEWLRNYNASCERGFLPAEDPVRRLPSEYADWEGLAADMPSLLAAGRIRKAVLELPTLAVTGLPASGDLERAMLLLAYFAHAYVYGGAPIATHIPAPVAIPLEGVARKLGRPPVLSYASHALYNWRRFDLGSGIKLGNLARLQHFLGGLDEEWFVLVHVAIEAHGGALLTAAVRAQDAALRADTSQVVRRLNALAAEVNEMRELLSRMPENCDPHIYYLRVRPFIFGWDNPGLPGGIVYQGVARFLGPAPRYRGETGAQSSLIPMVDEVLGVRLDGDELGRYVTELRGYMPPGHRRLVSEIGGRCNLRRYVIERGSNGELTDSYNACICALVDFRRLHLEFAGRYIHAQSRSDRTNPGSIGTGGTPFMRYLDSHVQIVRRHLV